SITFEKRHTPLQNKLLNIYLTLKNILQVFNVLRILAEVYGVFGSTVASSSATDPNSVTPKSTHDNHGKA
ncbi:MAG: hypothetical protein ACRDDD_02300, partial [Plesiomonas sp.]|uniref:hypothetical protein n=1 Tax=Plesiomonas sp. TaxID=2486279 RepID=UPI003EE53611